MEAEIWLMIDEAGDYDVGGSEEEATGRFDDSIGSTCARRLVRVVLTVPAFAVPTLTGTVPAEGTAGLSLAVEGDE